MAGSNPLPPPRNRGHCFALTLPAGLISTDTYEEKGLEEDLSVVGLGGSARTAHQGSPHHPCLGFPAEGTLAGLAHRDPCEEGRRSIPLTQD